jgi:hypothetical protein
VSPYRSQSPDTPEHVDRQLFELYRASTPEQDITRVWELDEWARARAMVGLCERFPAADQAELELRLFALRHGRELTQQVSGWDTESPEPPRGTA